MGAREREYRSRLARAAAEIEAGDRPAAAAADAFRCFLLLMDAIAPLVDAFPRPEPRVEPEPAELELYRRWRSLESSRHA